VERGNFVCLRKQRDERDLVSNHRPSDLKSIALTTPPPCPQKSSVVEHSKWYLDGHGFDSFSFQIKFVFVCPFLYRFRNYRIHGMSVPKGTKFDLPFPNKLSFIFSAINLCAVKQSES